MDKKPKKPIKFKVVKKAEKPKPKKKIKFKVVNVKMPVFGGKGYMIDGRKPLGLTREDLLQSIDNSSGLKYRTKANVIKQLDDEIEYYKRMGSMGKPNLEALEKQMDFVKNKYSPSSGIVARRLKFGLEMLKKPES
tara:strand:+ start:69 stop:476 length:408 start_codon:yes stop_codon:yes gene_type:complete